MWSWKPASATTITLLQNFAAHRAPAVEALLAISLAAVGVLLVLALREPLEVSDRAGRAFTARLATLTFLLFEACYLIVVLASFVSTTPTPDIDRRTTLPLQVGALCAALSFLAYLHLKGTRRRAHLLIGAILVGLCAFGYAVETADIVQGLHRTGLGYTAPRWQRSQTIHAVRNLPSEMSLISNEPMPVLLYTGRWPYPVAELEQDSPAQFLRYGRGPTEAERLFEGGGTALILFDTAAAEFERLYPGRGEERFAALIDGLRINFRGEDGAIYFAPSP